MVYYPEIRVLPKEATGAEKVVVFDHQVRNIEFSKHGGRNAREYVGAQRLYDKVWTAPRAGSLASSRSGGEIAASPRENKCVAADSRTDRIHTAGGCVTRPPHTRAFCGHPRRMPQNLRLVGEAT